MMGMTVERGNGQNKNFKKSGGEGQHQDTCWRINYHIKISPPVLVLVLHLTAIIPALTPHVSRMRPGKKYATSSVFSRFEVAGIEGRMAIMMIMISSTNSSVGNWH